jgi:retinol dehydrogenase-12
MAFSPPLDFYLSQLKTLPAAPQGDQLTGKIVILTGANSGETSSWNGLFSANRLGIGLEVAHHMTALSPERLILAVRDPSTATGAFEEVLQRAPKAVKIDLWQLDLGSFESVKTFAKQCQSLPRIDVLINNAG